MNAKVIAIAMQKGGVGKTTTCANLGIGLAQQGKKHRADLTLHKAAKAAFEELGVKKLPTIKALQAECDELFPMKNKAYSKYHTARKEMQDILTAKANIDRLLGMEQEQKAKEKSQDQR